MKLIFINMMKNQLKNFWLKDDSLISVNLNKKIISECKYIVYTDEMIFLW